MKTIGLRVRRWIAAITVAAAACLAIVTPLAAQSDEVPMPRPSPARTDATPAPEPLALPVQPVEPTAEQTILLQGANSPFAESGSAAPFSDAPLPLSGAVDTLPLPEGISAAAAANALAASSSQPPIGDAAPTDVRPGAYTLEARLSADGPPLEDGVIWRIFDEAPGADGKMALLGEAKGGTIHVRLESGRYLIHAAYGRSGVTRRVDVVDPTGGEVLVLDSGGMRLLSVNAHNYPLAPGEVRFDIYSDDASGSDERFLVVSGAPPGRVISLNAGTYHVVSRYGDANAIVRADIRIDAGKLTEATLYQTAARLTLKLVEQRGGEAIADTRWTVVTPSGEDVVESVGAFPTVVLAAGEYTAIARNNGRIFESNFTVEAGLHRDVEILVR